MLDLRSLAIPVMVLTLGVTAPSAAQEAAQAPPEALTRLTACRDVTDGAARLTCYDTAVAAFDSARLGGDVLVVDRAQVVAARRQLFGFDIASMPTMFGRGDESMDEIESPLVSARETAPNRWVFTLEDGTTWRQIETMRIDFRNRPGEPVRVRRGVLGSYRLLIGRGRSVGVRRQ